MDSWKWKEVCDLALDCARFAVSHRRRTGIGYDLKSDGSLVTAVDARNEKFLKENLQNLDEGSYFIGEETVLSCGADYIANALANRCWVVDPIDGTAPFAHGFSTWGVSIGYMQKGRLTDGAVVLPDTLRRIGHASFAGCTLLRSIRFPEGAILRHVYGEEASGRIFGKRRHRRFHVQDSHRRGTRRADKRLARRS